MARLFLVANILRKSNSSEIKQRRNIRRLTRYMDKAFSMGEEEFKANYRVSKTLFEVIHNELKPLMQTPRRKSDISLKYKILVTLSFLATGSYQRLVGCNYGTLMSQQSVSRAIRDVTAALNNSNILSKWIKFPQTQRERSAIKKRFYEKFHFPAVLGCIDGTHIAIIRPKDHEERFFNRKHFHSRNVMIISDADLNILSVDASFGGASHDSFIWNQHPIKQHIINVLNSGENLYFLGDSGYAQREYMMTPILNPTVGSPEENYNKLHCNVRNTVERTIGVLKNRWRCLLGHRVLHYHPDAAAKIINACCVLHNMCVKNNEFVEQNLSSESNESPSEDPISLHYQYAHNSTSTLEVRLGIEKRAALVQQLWQTTRL